eukprot:sb/3475106/
MERRKQPLRKCKDPPSADVFPYEVQNVAGFSPRPFIKIEEIFVNSCPPMKTEPADNEMYSGSIKCEPDADYKVEPILLTLKTEPVDSEHLGILPDCDNLEPIECSSSVADSSNLASLRISLNGKALYAIF